MCGSEDKNEPFIPCCENGHFIHQCCLMMLKDPICPMCRSERLKSMLQSTTLPLLFLCQTPYSQFGAAVAYCVGKMEHERYTNH